MIANKTRDQPEVDFRVKSDVLLIEMSNNRAVTTIITTMKICLPLDFGVRGALGVSGVLAAMPCHCVYDLKVSSFIYVMNRRELMF
jgi:hypothetical protein